MGDVLGGLLSVWVTSILGFSKGKSNGGEKLCSMLKRKLVWELRSLGSHSMCCIVLLED